VPAAFAAALDDDLNVPQALAVVHDTVRHGNNAMAGGGSAALAAALAQVRAMLGVLGLDPLGPGWAGAGAGADLRGVVDALAGLLIEQRQAARDRTDYDAADAIRDRMYAAGVLLEDTPDGTRWTIKP
jgi:cysteinyl-tRNA synthetase